MACDALHEIIGKPIAHEFGPNSAMMGHMPCFVCCPQAPLVLTPEDITISDTFSDGASVRMWTDGSVLRNDKFWLTTATFAVILECGSILTRGQVNHWNLTLYTAELWAIIIACSLSKQPLQVFSDNLTVVQQANELFSTQSVGPNWLCRDWWEFGLALFQ